MVDDAILRVVLAVIVGTLAAIVYSIRILVLVERRVAKIEEHLDRLIHQVLQKEVAIERAIKKHRR